MSKKIIKVVGTVATVVAGIALIGTGIGALAGGTMMLAGIASASAIASIAGAVAAGASLAGSLLTKKPSISSNATSRLFASLDPNAPRKIVLGETAMATDVVYQTYTGTNQEFYHQVLAVASHQCASIDQIWFDNELAWSGGTVQGRYVGYLTVATKLVGTTGGGFVIDAGWGANHSLTGCAQIWLKFKLTGNSKTAESPFSSQVPTRMTIRGKGALIYDPRLDTTVTGGSGSQRSGTQSGWSFGTTAGRNPALQLLWYLLGWKIGTKFAVGRGIPPERIDLASFLVAANICDESVALAAGGTEPRYRADGVFSENDDPSLVIGNLEAAMNGRLRDSGGKISLIIFKNDLASPAQTFTEADIIGEDLWRQTPSVEETFNTVRGRYVDASDNGLYQLAEYPEASLSSNDGIERIDSFDLPVVQSPSQAQRLAKTRLQRRQYGGVFTANFNAKAWTVTVGDIVSLSHIALGWSNKLFRVTRHGLATNGIAPMELREENSAIYAWSQSEAAAVQAAVPTIYDPTLAPTVKGIADASKTADWPTVADPNGTKPANNATNSADTTSPFGSSTVGSTITKINSNTSAIATARTDFQAADALLQAGINTLTTETNSIWGVVGRTTSQGLQSRTFTLESTVGGHATRITGVESTLNTPTTGVLARTAAAENAIVTNNTAIANRATAIESEITNARSGFSTLSAKFGTFSGTVADALAGKATVTSVENLNASVGGLSSQVTTISNATASLEGRFEASKGIVANANGVITGIWVHAASGPDYSISDVTVQASAFRVTDGTTTIAPFTVSGSQVLINGTLAVFSATSGARVNISSNLIELYYPSGNIAGRWGVIP